MSELEKVQSKSPAELIASAIKSDTDLDKLEKLLILQERWQNNEAKKAYHKAMAEFKASAPDIVKDKLVDYTNKLGQRVKYKHATLPNLCKKINPALSKYGLSASWDTSQNGQIVVTCKITHKLGHSEQTTLSAPMDNSGSKNTIQAIGSTITYLQRYTLLSLLGLSADDDDDGMAYSEKKLSEDQINTLRDWIIAANLKEVQVLKHFNVDSIEAMNEDMYNKILTALKARANKNGNYRSNSKKRRMV